MRDTRKHKVIVTKSFGKGAELTGWRSRTGVQIQGEDSMKQNGWATAAKEVGMGNPAEKTTVHPAVFIVDPSGTGSSPLWSPLWSRKQERRRRSDEAGMTALLEAW